MFKKLLLAASIAALTSTAAHAQLTLTGTTPITPALELDLPGVAGAEFEIPASFTLGTAGAFPTGTAFLVEITLPTGVVFSNQASPADLSGSLNPLNVTVSTGGAVGSSSVVYLVSDTLGGETAITYNAVLADSLTVNACPAADAVITMTANIDGSGTPIDGGIATSGTIITPCESALDGSITPENTDTSIALGTGGTSFALFAEGTAAPAVGPVPIGVVNYAINSGVSIVGSPASDLQAADISGISFDVVFENAAGISSVDLDLTTLATSVSSTLSGNIASFNITSSAEILDLTDNGSDIITVTSLGNTPIASQNVTVSNAVVTFNDSRADLVDTEDGAEGPIDPLQREGQTFGVFDWNSGSPAGTVSIYRITGLPAGSSTDYTVTISNSTVDGTYSGVLVADATGEEVITSVGFGSAAVPPYVRADMEINIETPLPLDVDRLMARNGIISTFGDGSNSNLQNVSDLPTNDGDNFSE